MSAAITKAHRIEHHRGWRYYLSCLGNKALVTTMKILISLLLLCGCLLHPMTVRAAEGQLDRASLKAMLEGMGYEPVEKKYNNSDDKYWEVPFAKGRWTYNAAISVNNPVSVWVTVEFGLYKGPQDDIPQSMLMGMLSENSSLVWSRFQYATSTKSFYLTSSLRNKNVSPADLRRVIDEIIAAADRTQKLWDPKQWPTSAVVESVRAAPEAAGASPR